MPPSTIHEDFEGLKQADGWTSPEGFVGERTREHWMGLAGQRETSKLQRNEHVLSKSYTWIDLMASTVGRSFCWQDHRFKAVVVWTGHDAMVAAKRLRSVTDWWERVR